MRAALVGCGAIASRWVRGLAADGRATPAVLVDPDQVAAARLARKHNLDLPVLPELADAVAEHAIDVVINLTPPQMHAKVSAQALCAGAHVLSEKPLATSLEDATELIDLARRHRRLVCVMQNRGTDEQFLAFADRVLRETRGPFLVTADTFVDLPVAGFRSNQRSVVTVDLAVHAFDQVRRVVAAAPLTVEARESPLGFLGDHCAVAVITVEFADGSIFSYRGGYTNSLGECASANGIWTVRGPKVRGMWGGDRAVVFTTDKPSAELLGMPDFLPSYLTRIAEMIDAVSGGADPPGPAVGNLGSIALLDAALESVATRCPATVRQPPPESA